MNDGLSILLSHMSICQTHVLSPPNIPSLNVSSPRHYRKSRGTAHIVGCRTATTSWRISTAKSNNKVISINNGIKINDVVKYEFIITDSRLLSIHHSMQHSPPTTCDSSRRQISISRGNCNHSHPSTRSFTYKLDVFVSNVVNNSISSVHIIVLIVLSVSPFNFNCCSSNQIGCRNRGVLYR